MHCPQCGQQQAPEVVRFCSRCGFPLDGVIQLLANGGVLPAYQTEGVPQISPRRRGVKQGGILLLTGALLVPLLGVLTSFSDSSFLQLLTAIAAVLCFVGGPLRMLYAALFEEGAPSWSRASTYTHPLPLHGVAPARNSLPAPQPREAAAWRQRPRTAELVRPPSVTEGTTRLLDRDDPSER
jgi:hypothetical protein